MKGKGAFDQNISSEIVSEPIYPYLEMKHEYRSVLHVVHARKVVEPPIVASTVLQRTEDGVEKIRKDQNALV
jgi:hypothetical protein